MNPVCAIVRPALAVGFLLLPISIPADGAEILHGGPHWACWYEARNLTLQCRLLRAPLAGTLQRASEVARKIDRRLPPQVKLIWGSPEKLSARRVNIPLWNEPYEMAFAHQLAEAVMCGSRFDCTVNFDPNADGLARQRAQIEIAAAAARELHSALDGDLWPELD